MRLIAVELKKDANDLRAGRRGGDGSRRSPLRTKISGADREKVFTPELLLIVERLRRL